MQPKVRDAVPGGHLRGSLRGGRWGLGSLLLGCALLLPLLSPACGRDARRANLVEADTADMAAGPRGGTVSAGDPEVVFLDADPRPRGGAPAGVTSGDGAEEAPVAPAARGDGSSDRARPSGAGETEGDAADEPGPMEARERGRRPPPPRLLGSGRILLPAGTVFVLELRTPIHTATTLIGDRFAARMTQDVAAGGRVVIAAGTLVEGRVSRVGSASEPGRIAYIELVARKVWLPGGRHLRIAAKVLDVTGQEVVESSGDLRASALVTGGVGGAPLGEAAREARIAILEDILEELDGPAIITASTDREIIIPTGTPFTVELTEPLMIPADAVG